jgi:hypothetical protein
MQPIALDYPVRDHQITLLLLMETPLRLITAKLITLSLIGLGLAGCISEAQQHDSVAGLGSEVERLEARLSATEASLQALTAQQTITTRETTGALSQLSSQLQTSMQALPLELAELCSAPAAMSETECDASVQTVIMAADKMLVGELESVWIEPPGVTLTARIDTGASSSSLHADELLSFERDGDDWVRFNILVNDEAIPVEAAVSRYVRVIQQADAEGSRRPVVNLRIRLGDIQDTFEFTLADRSHLDHQIILGRNFLTDMAVVDVAQRFIQPKYQPEAD